MFLAKFRHSTSIDLVILPMICLFEDVKRWKLGKIVRDLLRAIKGKYYQFNDYIITWYREISRQHPPFFPVLLILIALLCLVVSHDQDIFSFIRSLFPVINTLKPIRAYDLYGFVVLFIVPFIFLLLTRKNLRDFGFSLGNIKLALPVFFFLLAGLTIIDFIISKIGSFQSFYGRDNISNSNWLLVFFSYFLFMWAWEFMNRGFLLFGLKPYIGKYAIFVQLIPFVLLHLDKPGFELYGSIIFGLVFGYYAYVTNSFLYCALLHAYFATMGDVFIALG